MYVFRRCHARMKVDMKLRCCEVLEVHSHLPMIEIGSPIAVDVTDRIELVDTNRGGIFYVLDGKKFIKSAHSVNCIARYRCSLYTQQCKSKISVVNGKILMINNHNHE